MSGWLTHCHVLIMRAHASRSCSTAVTPYLTDRHCGAIVIWNILYCSCGGDTRLPTALTPFFFCLSRPCFPRTGLQWREKLFTQSHLHKGRVEQRVGSFTALVVDGSFLGESSYIKFEGESWTRPDMCLQQVLQAMTSWSGGCEKSS